MYTDGKTVHYGYDEQIRLSELKEGGRIISYGYDALGRLSEIQKDGQIQTAYGYDAFGNRTWKEENGERTSYQYNILNQMVSEKHREVWKEYGYDKRGNLTSIRENEAWKKQYVYGAINRLEEALDVAGKQARYQYNGLGHRVGKQEGVLPEEKLDKLEPQKNIGMEVGNSRQIAYTLDLTRLYHNLLERTEESQSQRYFWYGNVAAFEESGKRSYYLQDELGSPLRIEDESGFTRETYGYGAFGEDLYGNQGVLQVFGYTGYQRDNVAGTYYAQAREYQAEVGRFVSEDFVGGVTGHPYSINRYQYCAENPLAYIDLNGKFLITAILATAAIGAGVGAGINLISQGINIARGKQKKFNVGSFFGSAIEGGIVAGVSAIPGVGSVAVGLSAGVGGGINSVLKQYGESGEIDIGQVAEDAMVSGVVGGIAYKFTSIRNAKAGKTPTAQEISANAKTRDARKKVLDEIKASGKTPSGLRRRVDSSYALKHKELLKKYAQSSIVGNSKELLANQLEYETDIYVIKGHANIKGYIKDMLKDFLPIENSDDWIMSILSNNIKVDKDGEETLEICGVMG
ncbi:RHS repeat domain-containing protein [Blautia sp.]|uniref:RHS repeat domain-containing protein n=1 Tax=Blautia sp. TaxID=1955243 RepID=UPI003AF66A18